MKTDYLKMVWRMVAFLAAFYPVSDADVVSGTPAENFLRAVLPQKSTAPEGIVYQVPDDKLEPGKLYHDASQDKSRMVTRKRVVGSLNQTSSQEAGQVLLGNLKFDVTFHYASSRESKGKGVLTWSVNRLDVDVDKTSIENQIKLISDALKAAEYETPAASQDAAAKDALYQKAVEYAIERTVAHENQHVMDATINPVWLYSISSSRDTNPYSLSAKSDREMINSLNPELAKELDDQRLELIAIAEARAVFAEVRQATYQLEPLLDIDKENLPDAQKYVPALFGGIRKGIKQSEVAVKKRMDEEGIVRNPGTIDRGMFEEESKKILANFTYANVLDTWKSDRDLFNLAQQDVLYDASAVIQIDGNNERKYTYEVVYKLYYGLGMAYDEYSASSDSVGEKMAGMVEAYKKNIEKMYELIHAELYAEDKGLQGIKDEITRTDPSGTGGGNRKGISSMSCVDWLTAVLNELNGEPQDWKLAELVVTPVHNQKYTDAETEKLRAGIFRAIGKLVQTGYFYGKPGTDKERLIDDIICSNCLAGMKSRASGTKPFRISRVKKLAHERFHAKELTIKNPDAQKAYNKKFEKEFYRKPRRWKEFEDYDYAMYPDKILNYSNEIYEEEAKEIEKEAERLQKDTRSSSPRQITPLA